MKSIGSLSVIVTVFVAALTTICPVPSRAASQAPDFRGELRTEEGSTAKECPLVHTSTPTDCAATGTDLSQKNSVVMLRNDGDAPQAYQPGDSSGELLEGLVHNGSDR